MALTKTAKNVGFVNITSKAFDSDTMNTSEYADKVVFTSSGIALNGAIYGVSKETYDADMEKLQFSGGVVQGYRLLNANDTDASEQSKYRFFSVNDNSDTGNIISDSIDETKLYYDIAGKDFYVYVQDLDEYVAVGDIYSTALAAVSQTYLTSTNAASTYLTKADAEDTYTTPAAVNGLISTAIEGFSTDYAGGFVEAYAPDQEASLEYASLYSDEAAQTAITGNEGKIYYVDFGDSGMKFYYWCDDLNKFVTAGQLFSEAYNEMIDDFVQKTNITESVSSTSADDEIPSAKAVYTALNGQLESPSFTGAPTAPTATSDTDTTQIATTAFVQDVVKKSFAANDAMVFKGVLNSAEELVAITDYSAGWTYKVGTAGAYNDDYCEVGDMIICISDYTGAFQTQDWTIIQTNETGSVITASTSTAVGDLAVFAGTDGVTIKDGGGVTANNPTLAYGGTSTVGSVAGTEFNVTMPAALTKSDLGLGNVDNTSDADKVVAQATKDGDGNVISSTYVKQSSIVTSLSSSGTDSQVPSAKAVYDGTVNVVTLTQAEYDALTTKDERTVYLVTDSETVYADLDLVNFVASNLSSTNLTESVLYNWYDTVYTNGTALGKTVYVHFNAYPSSSNTDGDTWKKLRHIGARYYDSLTDYFNNTVSGATVQIYSCRRGVEEIVFGLYAKGTSSAGLVMYKEYSNVLYGSDIVNSYSSDATNKAAAAAAVKAAYDLASTANTNANAALTQLTWYTEE